MKKVVLKSLSVLVVIGMCQSAVFADDKDISLTTKVIKKLNDLVYGECNAKPDENNVYRCSNDKGLYYKLNGKDYKDYPVKKG